MNYLFLLLIAGGAYWLLHYKFSQRRWTKPTKTFPNSWRIILAEKVAFYIALSKEEKQRFEFKVQEFLLNCRVTGVSIVIDDTDKLLVASSAVIPIFNFPNWTYNNLFEVLLYPTHFNEKFETDGEGRTILGMVGTGYMEGKMILSKTALRHGFENETDKKNTAIHEFVHLVDKTDGSVDGVPSALMDRQYTIPWLELMSQGIDDIYKQKSDINPYGGTNQQEFFAVVSEYFFERPKLLEKKHPELYGLLQEIFAHDLSSRKANMRKLSIGRNSPCPCNSGQKFKRCCGVQHF